MSFGVWASSLLILLPASLWAGSAKPAFRRVVILKIDGLNGDLLYKTMREMDPSTGKSRLPWFAHIFGENGTVFENFYTRGISLSAPSWSILDTGHHTVIRGNVEYDRYTGYVYDYLNLFPFYIGYARKRQVDMPGVEVLDRAGIPLLIDRFAYPDRFQSFQLFQRGVRWTTLRAVLGLRVKSQFLSPVESVAPPSMDALFARQTEAELTQYAARPNVQYLDFYRGEIDHEGHATNQREALLATMKRLDDLAGRISARIESNPGGGPTLFVVVSDHGMNNSPAVFSQAFSLPDLLNSAAGGAHHVVTNRHQMSDFKIMGLDPLVQRVVTPSTASFYLQGQASHYPTAWLDLDGNERAALHLRNSELNQIHTLLLQLSRNDLPPTVRKAAGAGIVQIVNRHRERWTRMAAELEEELNALHAARGAANAEQANNRHRWTAEEKARGEDKEVRRDTRNLSMWEGEEAGYREFLGRLRKLLAFVPDSTRPLQAKISDLIPEMELGDSNSVHDIQNYTVGLGPAGIILNAAGMLDEGRSFRRVNYFPLFTSQQVRNNPQPDLPPHPVDFTVMRLPENQYPQEDPPSSHAYWLYGNEDSQLVVLTDPNGRIALKPIAHLTGDSAGKITWVQQSWRSDLPLRLFEDPALNIPGGDDRAAWLSSWHTDREWLEATHLCHYSNAVVGITEQLSPVEENVAGSPGTSAVLLRYERRRRALVAADLQIFAADGWNFNVRNFNPGGNHGGFFRISTHSVWMMSGPGIPAKSVVEPYDSLNFASTVLNLLGKPAPLPERIVDLQ